MYPDVLPYGLEQIYLLRREEATKGTPENKGNVEGGPSTDGEVSFSRRYRVPYSISFQLADEAY